MKDETGNKLKGLMDKAVAEKELAGGCLLCAVMARNAVIWKREWRMWKRENPLRGIRSTACIP